MNQNQSPQKQNAKIPTFFIIVLMLLGVIFTRGVYSLKFQDKTDHYGFIPAAIADAPSDGECEADSDSDSADSC